MAALERVAAVDPEDVQMHYTAMLAYRGLGRDADATREEQLFLRFKAEESAQSITGGRRLLKPEENNERQQIHEHEGVLLADQGSQGSLGSRGSHGSAGSAGSHGSSKR